MYTKLGLILGLFFVFSHSTAQSTEQELKDLSAQKWTWMSEKNVEKLAPLFHDKSKFLYMEQAKRAGDHSDGQHLVPESYGARCSRRSDRKYSSGVEPDYLGVFGPWKRGESGIYRHRGVCKRRCALANLGLVFQQCA
jgi:hypothetical protein